MNRGFVYALSHPAWLDETLASAATVQRHMPELERQLFATADIAALVNDKAKGLFTQLVIVEMPAFHARPRFDSMLETTLDQAIFLDGDTFILDQTYELFEVLEHFDVALTPAPQHLHPSALKNRIYDLLPDVSRALPEWNAGVIVANVTADLCDMVKEWMRLFDLCRANGHRMDQPALRSALSTSKLRVASLPYNYNFRANMKLVVKGRVKILHAHGDLAAIADTINLSEANRVYVPDRQHIHGKKPKGIRSAKSV